MDPVTVDPSRLRLRIEAEMDASPDSDEAAVDYAGTILLLDEHYEEATEIGQIAYRVVHAYWNEGEENENAFWTMDELDEDATYIAEALQEHLDEAAPDGIIGVLVIDNVWIDPRYRGQGLASHALWRVLKLFEGSITPSHAVAVLYSWDKPSRDAEWERIEETDPHEFRHRVARLHHLFARAGFEPMGDSDVVIFPLEREVRPPSASVYVTPRS